MSKLFCNQRLYIRIYIYTYTLSNIVDITLAGWKLCDRWASQDVFSPYLPPPPWEGIFGSMWRGLFFRINGYNVSTSIFINKVLFIYLSTSHFILLLPAFYFVVEVSYYYIRLRLFIRLIILAEIDIVEIPSSCDSAPQPPSACQIWYLPFVYCNVSTWCSLQAMTSWAVRISRMLV